MDGDLPNTKMWTDPRPAIELGWKDLADNHPGAWTPSGSEEEDVDTDEGNLNLYNIGIVWPDCSNDSDDKFADKHTDSAVDQ